MGNWLALGLLELDAKITELASAPELERRRQLGSDPPLATHAGGPTSQPVAGRIRAIPRPPVAASLVIDKAHHGQGWGPRWYFTTTMKRTLVLISVCAVTARKEDGGLMSAGAALIAVHALMLEARQFDVNYLITPMVETPYTLTKYIAANDKVFTQEERGDVKFLFNVETIAAYGYIDELVAIASAENGWDGIVFGRVDFSGSLGIGREGIKSNRVTEAGEDIAAKCRDARLEFVVGGAVSIDALTNLKRLHGVYLDRFQTRKVIFQSSALDSPKLEAALRQAVHFELLRLLNKREYYGLMYKENQKRLEMLESRWQVPEGA